MADAKKRPSLPANYVTILQLQERWIKEQKRKQEQEELEKRKLEEEPSIKEEEEEEEEDERKRIRRESQESAENAPKLKSDGNHVKRGKNDLPNADARAKEELEKRKLEEEQKIKEEERKRIERETKESAENAPKSKSDGKLVSQGKNSRRKTEAKAIYVKSGKTKTEDTVTSEKFESAYVVPDQNPKNDDEANKNAKKNSQPKTEAKAIYVKSGKTEAKVISMDSGEIKTEDTVTSEKFESADVVPDQNPTSDDEANKNAKDHNWPKTEVKVTSMNSGKTKTEDTVTLEKFESADVVPDQNPRSDYEADKRTKKKKKKKYFRKKETVKPETLDRVNGEIVEKEENQDQEVERNVDKQVNRSTKTELRPKTANMNVRVSVGAAKHKESKPETNQGTLPAKPIGEVQKDGSNLVQVDQTMKFEGKPDDHLTVKNEKEEAQNHGNGEPMDKFERRYRRYGKSRKAQKNVDDRILVDENAGDRTKDIVKKLDNISMTAAKDGTLSHVKPMNRFGQVYMRYGDSRRFDKPRNRFGQVYRRYGDSGRFDISQSRKPLNGGLVWVKKEEAGDGVADMVGSNQ